MYPPTFSNSKRVEGFLDVQRHKMELINDYLKGLKSGAYFTLVPISENLYLKRKIKAATVKDISKATILFDFEGRLFSYCFLITK